MIFGIELQALIDAVIGILYNAFLAQYGAFFTLLELFQTLTGGGVQ